MTDTLSLLLFWQAEWTRLEHLTFGNFRFDNVLVESVSRVPYVFGVVEPRQGCWLLMIDSYITLDRSLRVLVLKGNGNGHLDHQTLSSLLLLNSRDKYKLQQDAITDWNLLEVHVKDCPIPHRLLLENELSDDFDANTSSLMSLLLWL